LLNLDIGRQRQVSIAPICPKSSQSLYANTGQRELMPEYGWQKAAAVEIVQRWNSPSIKTGSKKKHCFVVFHRNRQSDNRRQPGAIPRHKIFKYMEIIMHNNNSVLNTSYQNNVNDHTSAMVGSFKAEVFTVTIVHKYIISKPM